MQVKKFEARSVKEALEMVKSELGPDAVILSVKDHNRKYGLGGEGSIEVTAAVSELTLKKKKFAESKLRDKDKQTFAKSPARSQKDFIEKAVERHLQGAAKAQPQEPAKLTPVRRPTSRQYIEIADEASYGDSEDFARQRIRNAAREAWQASQKATSLMSASPTRAGVAPNPNEEMLALRAEISGLKKVIADFRSIPQRFVSAHPGAEFGLPFELSFMFEKLNQAGIDADFTYSILSLAQNEISPQHLKKRAMVDAWVANYLLNWVEVQESPFAGHLHLFVGPSGHGKTTTLIKMASHLAVECRKSVAIVSADTFKVGAAEQLSIYAKILGLPFAVVRDQSDWPKVMMQIGERDCILGDIPGLPLRDINEINLIKRLMPARDLSAQVHFVGSCKVKDADLMESAARYRATDYADFIFTCLDESVNHGVICNFQNKFKLPLHSFGIGPRIPEDFEEATKERVLDLIFKLSKIKRVDTP